MKTIEIDRLHKWTTWPWAMKTVATALFVAFYKEAWTVLMG
jgi:hypothetical protein